MSADTIAAAVQTVERGFSSFRSDLRAIDEPLQFCLNGSPLSITMRSPGSDWTSRWDSCSPMGLLTTCARFCRCSPNPLTIPPENSGDRVTIGLGPYCDAAE